MRMIQTVEFIISGHCGSFCFNPGDIYEMVILTEKGAYWVLDIMGYKMYFPKHEVHLVLKFLNKVPV